MKSCYQNVSVSRLCGLFGRTRQSYYKYMGKQQEYSVRSGLVLARVREIRKDSHRMGTLKLRSILAKEMGSAMVGLGRDAFFRLLRENDLLVKCKRRYAITTQSDHRFKKWPDLVQRRHALRPEQIWVSDITYIRIRDKWIYLCLVTDAYSRKIVGYKLTHRPTAKSCISALKMAMSHRMYPQSDLTHHSDRGIQYCSTNYVNILKENGIAISMTQSGSPYDNAVAERLNGILKSEYRMAETFPDYKTALAQLVKAVNIYNHFRPHMACNMMSPQQAHQQWQSQNVPKGFQRRSPETKKFRSKARETVARERTTDNSKKIDNDNHIQ